MHNIVPGIVGGLPWDINNGITLCWGTINLPNINRNTLTLTQTTLPITYTGFFTVCSQFKNNGNGWAPCGIGLNNSNRAVLYQYLYNNFENTTNASTLWIALGY